MLPVASGGLHPGLLPELFDIYGTIDIVVQLGGGTQGHPMGDRSWGESGHTGHRSIQRRHFLDEYAKTHKELKAVLDKWGYIKPK